VTQDGGGGISVSVDREMCMGTGVCIAFAPRTFAHDSETKAIVLDPAGDTKADIEAAAEGCPTGAIMLANEEGV
jgi:ferredoxin